MSLGFEILLAVVIIFSAFLFSSIIMAVIILKVEKILDNIINNLFKKINATSGKKPEKDDDI